ncbi:MAG: amidohydrolase family protein [Bacteroidetes bacterium]|nr:amidohydrolase family protein [Bacteroidota bacterium]
MQKLTADYIFPISQPSVKNGIVIVDDNGVISENVIDPANLDYNISDVKPLNGFICPGFINTHCHLELSYLKEKIHEHTGIDKFIIELEQQRKGINEEEKAQALSDAENEMIENGIVAVGDICNDNSTFPLKNKGNIYYHSFIETFSSNPEKADIIFEKALKLYDEIKNKNNSCSITPHAPYSLSKKLFLKIKTFAEKSGNILSIHHQESEEENKFFMSKNGNIKDMLTRFGVTNPDFYNSGLRPLAGIAEYIPNENNLLLVHNTVTTDNDIEFATSYFKNLYWCFCPNANLYIEQRLPDFALFFNNKCKITIGTDSLASNKILSVLAELKTISASIPFVPLTELLKWATFNGAEFLKISHKFGSIEKGKSPGILLIENVDVENMKLIKDTEVKAIA